MNKNSILYSDNIYYCRSHAFIQKELHSDNYSNIFDEIIRKKYGNEFMFTFAFNMLKKSKLLLKNDEKTKKMIMFVHNLYTKK